MKIESSAARALLPQTSGESLTQLQAPVPSAVKPWLTHEYSVARSLGDGVTLLVEPRLTETRAEFQASHGPYCLAVDSRVAGPSWLDYERKQANRDHHAGVDRLTTPCSCLQIYDDIVSGRLQRAFSEPGGELRVVLCVKHCDPDEGFCAALLARHKDVIEARCAAQVLRLVELEDRLDRPGGAVAVDPKSREMQEMAWICRPYEEYRLREQRGTLFASGDAMARVITSTVDRFWLAASGRSETCELDTRYRELCGGRLWTMIDEQGLYGRIGFAHANRDSGQQVFIAVREIGGGAYRYTLGKLPGGAPFPLESLYAVLNAAEGIDPGAADRWSGSDYVGGSPFMRESALGPQEVQRIMEAFVSACERTGPERVQTFIAEELPRLTARR